MGASIVLTIINSSISLGLGLAGTVQTNIEHGGKTETKELLGYRGALWVSVGLAGLGLLFSSVFLFRSYWKARPNRQQNMEEASRA